MVCLIVCWFVFVVFCFCLFVGWFVFGLFCFCLFVCLICCFFLVFFYTIQSHVMVQKLLRSNLSSSVVYSIFNYLTNRPQFISLTGTRSDAVWTNTGAHRVQCSLHFSSQCTLLTADILIVHAP